MCQFWICTMGIYTIGLFSTNRALCTIGIRRRQIKRSCQCVIYAIGIYYDSMYREIFGQISNIRALPAVDPTIFISDTSSK